MRMMYRVLAVLSAAAVIVQPQAGMAAGKEPIVLQPSLQWHLDMGEDRCRLARRFGQEDEHTVFYFEQWEPSNRADFVVAGPPVERFKPERDASFAFTPGGNTADFQFPAATLDTYGQVVAGWTTIVPDPNPVEPGSERQPTDYALNPRGLPALETNGTKGITRLVLKQRGRRDVVLELGSLENAVLALNMCMTNLVEHWGFDSEEQKAVVLPPRIPNLQDVVREIQENYPKKAERKGAQADFHMRLTVDAEGMVEDCKLVNQTLAADFDLQRHPCTVMKDHATMEPARLADGTAVRSYLTNRVLFRLYP